MTQALLRHALVVVLVSGMWTGQAAAQNPSRPEPRSLVPAVFPRWDLSGSLGLLNISTADTGSAWDSWDQKFEYDVWYVDNVSLAVDFGILVKTVASVAGRRGITPDDTASMPVFRGNKV